MDNEMLQHLLYILMESTDSNKDDNKIKSLYSDIESVFSKFLPPQKDMYEDYINEVTPDMYQDLGNNNVHPDRDEKEYICPSYETNELVKNSGFEITSPTPNQAFINWQQTMNKAAVKVSSSPFEGELAARFVSLYSDDLESKTAQLFQNISVTPGCCYELSFAENFFKHSKIIDFKVRLSARVFYGDPNNPAHQVDLINIIIYKPRYKTVENRGFNFHRKAAEIPVPDNVSYVTVEFMFEVMDLGGTDWRIDSVSIRPVSGTGVCNH